MTARQEIGKQVQDILAIADTEQHQVYWRFGVGLTMASIFMLLISSRLDAGSQMVFGSFSIIVFFIGVYHIDKSSNRKSLKKRVREILSRWA